MATKPLAVGSAPEPANGKQWYRTLKPVALGPDYHATGVEVRLSDRQAEFLLVSGAIERVAEAAAAETADAVTPKKSSAKEATK